MRHTDLALAMAEQEMSGVEVGYLPIQPLELLRERVASAIANTSFYRDIYKPFGPMPTGDDFLHWFASLPIVNKAQLQAAGPAELLNPMYTRSELVAKPTSGSTGIPFTLLLNNTVINFRKWRFQRPHQWVVKEPPTKLVFVFPWDFVTRTPREELTPAAAAPAASLEESDGDEPAAGPPRTATPGAPFRSLPKKTKRTVKATRTAASVHQEAPILDRPFTVNSWLPMEELFTTLRELAPATLVGFASSLAALARWMLQHDERLPSLVQVWTTSEVLSPDGTDAIRGAMGCLPLAAYASNEFGFMAWEAEAGGPLTFEGDRLHVECLEPDSALPARLGDFSRLVVTDLLNDTMPLIRYDIADIARVGEPVQVTYDLRCMTVTDLQGKEADLLQPPDARTVTTFQVLGAIKDHLPNAQYRFVGITPDRYVLQYRPGLGFSPGSLDPTVRVLSEMLGPGVEVVPQRVDGIAREPSGKLRPVVNLHNIPEARRRELAATLGVASLLPINSRDAATSIVSRALAAVRGLHPPGEAVDESQELYADLALDSLQFVRIVLELERELGREIDDEDLLAIDLITVGDLVTCVEHMLPTG
jgi:phenylacetate-coenzyme A ligase PaaK-like adenylate-forming protein/acyl carrier protein